MVIPSIAAIAAALALALVLVRSIVAQVRQPTPKRTEVDGCVEWRLDDDTYFCYAPTPERVGEIRQRLEVKDGAERSQRP